MGKSTNKRNYIRYLLHNFDGLPEQIKQLQEDIITYKNMEIDYVMNQAISDIPHPRGTITKKVEICSIKRADHILNLEKELSVLIERRRKMLNSYGKLNESQKKIYKLRYVEKFSLKFIFHKMHVDAYKIDERLVDIFESGGI
ncbi:MAG: hypothetical protein ACM3O3_09785 [Syntrophothermus sp.]